MKTIYKYYKLVKCNWHLALDPIALCLLFLISSCSKNNIGPLDMSPIFVAVHNQAAKQAKDYEGKFNQFDSTKPFFIYTDYNFKASIRDPLERMIIPDSLTKDDKFFSKKVFIKKTLKYIPIDTFPRWDNIHNRMFPFKKRLDKDPYNKTIYREYENSGEFIYYLVRILKPVFNKKNNVYLTALHITDNVFENDGFYYYVKFQINGDKINVVSTRQYEISIGVPPLVKEK